MSGRRGKKSENTSLRDLLNRRRALYLGKNILWCRRKIKEYESEISKQTTIFHENSALARMAILAKKDRVARSFCKKAGVRALFTIQLEIYQHLLQKHILKRARSSREYDKILLELAKREAELKKTLSNEMAFEKSFQEFKENVLNDFI